MNETKVIDGIELNRRYPNGDKELARKWVAALRSGNYPQTVGALRDSRGYCCLGVLDNIVDATAWVSPLTGALSEQWRWMKEDSVLTEDVANRLTGWLPENYEFTATIIVGSRLGCAVDETVSLAGLNDSGWTFDKIADAIEWCFMLNPTVG